MKSNYGESAIIKSQEIDVDLREWRDNNPNKKGNVRDYANISQLVCLSNLESLNALFINEGMGQSIRLAKLNKIAISQMKILVDGVRLPASTDAQLESGVGDGDE